MKDKIIIWTPDLPEGYGAFDEDDGDEIVIEINENEEDDESSIEI